jgi:hypothetical protein
VAARLAGQDRLGHHLLPPAAGVDIGGGPAVCARWLAAQGYEAHLADPVSLHIEQARERPSLRSPARCVRAGLLHPQALPDRW